MTANIILHELKITRSDREQRNGHGSFILWFTGLSCSGKSTLVSRVEEVLFARGLRTYTLDGDNIRHGLCSGLTFSLEDRKENIRRVGELSKLFIDAGIVVLAAFISPFKVDRDNIRASVAEGDFIEIYCNAPLSVCERRDRKGLYAKARKNEIPEFTGISSPYEAPEHPEINVMTSQSTVDECIKQIIDYLQQREKFRI